MTPTEAPLFLIKFKIWGVMFYSGGFSRCSIDLAVIKYAENEEEENENKIKDLSHIKENCSKEALLFIVSHEKI